MTIGPEEPKATSYRMSRIPSKDTQPEKMLRKELWARGVRYRLHCADLPGKPDLVFRGAKVAVFVDGDFWHGRVLRENGARGLRDSFKRKGGYWVAKISKNVERDREVDRALERLGWTVLRFWASGVREHVGKVADEVEGALS